MDYGTLIKDAMARNHWTSRYKVAQALGYTNKSAIYQIEQGKKGLSAGRLLKLMELAGKTVKMMAGASLISIALPYGNADVRAADNHTQQRADIYIMRIYGAGN